MKKFLLFFFLSLSFSDLNSQNPGFCGTDELMKIWLNNNPGTKDEFLKRRYESNKQDSLAFINGYANKTLAATIYTIPIVFHVLHLNGSENISDAQILDELSVLNRDFRKLNADTANIFAPFKAADVRFEFRLATKDSLGNC